MKKKYIYKGGDFEKSKYYINKFTEKERKILENNMIRNDPVRHFILQARYKSVFTMKFKKNSVLGETINLLKSKVQRLFFCTIIEEIGDEYSVSLGLSDMVKLLLIDDLRERTGFSKHMIYKILLLIRYEEYCTLSDKKELDFDVSLYYLNPADFKRFNRNTTKEELNAKINNIKSQVKETGTYMLHTYFERETFEKVLYYMLLFRKDIYLSINFSENSKSHIGDISYIYDDKLNNLTIPGIVINLFRFIGVAKLRQNNKSLINKTRKEIGVRDKKRKVLLDKKYNYIIMLHKKINLMLTKIVKDKKEPSQLYKKLKKELIINELEKDIGIYEINSKGSNSSKKERKESSVLIKSFASIIPHLNMINNGEVNISINKKKLKEFSVYSKHNAEDLDALKDKYPSAEIGLVEHKGIRQHSTVRYKKKLK